MSLANRIVRRGGCHWRTGLSGEADVIGERDYQEGRMQWRTGLSGEADHIESGEMLEECSKVDPGSIFDDVKSLADGSDDIVK